MRGLMLLTLWFSQFASATSDCAMQHQQASRESVTLHPAERHRVSGPGRLYFYSAPIDSCKSPQTFVIAADSLLVYAEYQDWYQVIYIHAKTGAEHEGWVKKQRLQFQGLLAPKP